MDKLKFKFGLGFGFGLIVLLLITSQISIIAENEPEHIIIINSYNNGFEWTDDQVVGIMAGILEKHPNVIIYNEYLDQKSFPGQVTLEQSYALFKVKYADSKIDLIVTTDDVAMQFAIDNREELFDNAPIIFGSVNMKSAIERIAGVVEITGVYENIDTEGTAELIKKLHNNLKTVYAITENTESGRSTWIRIQDGFEKLIDEGIQLVNLNDKSYEELKDIIANAGSDSAVVMASFGRDIDDLVYSPYEVSKEFAMVSAIPIYILHDNSLNDYVVGGSMLSGELHGLQVAELVNEFLDGVVINDIPIDNSMRTSKVINYLQIENFNIKESNIPADYLILNQPFSFYTTYKKYIYVVLFVIIILVSLVVGLLINIKLRKKAQLDLLEKHKELSQSHDMIRASEEELIMQNDELHSQQQQLRESEEKYRLTSESANDIHWSWDMENNQRFIEAKLYNLLDYEIGSIDTQDKWYEIVHAEDMAILNERLEGYLKHEDEKYSAKFRIRHRNGEYLYILSTAKGVLNAEGQYVKLYGTYTDITQSKKDHEQILELAYTDYLTKLPNRMSIRTLAESLMESKIHDEIVLYFIDLDNFKFINNSFGHRVGDSLLIEVAARLNLLKTEYIHVGRIGGDEFVIVVQDANHIRDAFTIELLEVFKLPFKIEERFIYSTASIGYVVYPEDGQTYDDLLVKADIAMYKMKECGKNQIDRFSDSMEGEMSEKIEYLTLLSQALEKNEFSLEFQPFYETNSKTISGFEALLRWDTLEFGRIPPTKFIPLAESCGLIIPIGIFVMREAFRFAKAINERCDSRKVVAINISVVQLFGSDFVAQVEELLKEENVNPSYIEFEVTESIYAENFDLFRMQLFSISKLGISISLDDFGTGYSSLTYLRKVPISKLKIDKKFIDDILLQKEDYILVKTIIAMGHEMGFAIVAEGVEEKVQLEFLETLNCQFIQGYYFSKPICEVDCYELLKRDNDNQNL